MNVILIEIGDLGWNQIYTPTKDQGSKLVGKQFNEDPDIEGCIGRGGIQINICEFKEFKVYNGKLVHIKYIYDIGFLNIVEGRRVQYSVVHK